MRLSDTLLEICQVIYGGGGVNFIKIRLVLEDVEKEIEKGNPKAIQLQQELDHLLEFVQVCEKMEFTS